MWKECSFVRGDKNAVKEHRNKSGMSYSLFTFTAAPSLLNWARILWMPLTKRTDSVPPPSSLWPPKYQVIWAGGLEPVLRQTISDSRPTTNWSTLFTILTVTGATGNTKKIKEISWKNILRRRTSDHANSLLDAYENSNYPKQPSIIYNLLKRDDTLFWTRSYTSWYFFFEKSIYWDSFEILPWSNLQILFTIIEF